MYLAWCKWPGQPPRSEEFSLSQWTEGQKLTNSNRELASEVDLEGWIMHGLMDTEAHEQSWDTLRFG